MRIRPIAGWAIAMLGPLAVAGPAVSGSLALDTEPLRITIAPESLESVVERMDSLTARGAAAEAYEIGLGLIPQHAGLAHFDFAFGLAALEAGRPDQALLAFQRVQIEQPANPRVRLEVARTYYTLGEFPPAREQFQRVLATNPPPVVQDRINVFLQRMDQIDRANSATWSPYIGVAAGYDDNVSSGHHSFTADLDFGSVVIPDFSFDSSRVGAQYGELIAGGEYTRPLSRHTGWFAGGAWRERRHAGAGDHDQRLVDLSAGGLVMTDLGRLRLPLQLQLIQLGGTTVRRAANTGAELTQALNEQRQLTHIGQLGINETIDNGSGRLSGSVNIATMLSQQLPAYGVQLSGGPFVGGERPFDSEHEAEGRWFAGARGGAAWQPRPRHSLGLNLSYQLARYHGGVIGFDADRRIDHMAMASLGWTWLPARHWNLRTSLDLLSNRSNIGVYAHDRWLIGSNLRYDW